MHSIADSGTLRTILLEAFRLCVALKQLARASHAHHLYELLFVGFGLFSSSKVVLNVRNGLVFFRQEYGPEQINEDDVFRLDDSQKVN